MATTKVDVVDAVNAGRKCIGAPYVFPLTVLVYMVKGTTATDTHPISYKGNMRLNHPVPFSYLLASQISVGIKIDNLFFLTLCKACLVLSYMLTTIYKYKMIWSTTSAGMAKMVDHLILGYVAIALFVVIAMCLRGLASLRVRTRPKPFSTVSGFSESALPYPAYSYIATIFFYVFRARWYSGHDSLLYRLFLPRAGATASGSFAACNYTGLEALPDGQCRR